MKPYTLLILDDEAPARDLLASYCQKIDQVAVVGSVGHALEAKRIIENTKVDILLSDIQMDDLTGIDLLKLLKKPPVTLFTTAYSEYALESYDLDVVDYLVKPISFQRFLRAVEKAIELIAFKGKGTMQQDTRNTSDYVFVKTNRKMVKVDFKDILFVESYGEYVKIHTQNDMILALQTMAYVEDLLPETDFIRIHRSHIVNLNHIQEVEGNRISLESHTLVVSKRMKEAFLKRIGEKGVI
ncbi:MAG: LytTR family DNA-binding domain-containing protein [Bacteroidota bacterium]